MTETPETPETPEETTPAASAGDRIAKVIARAGRASRREAERLILEGKVSVNGQTISSPALDVTPADRIVVDGTALEEPQPTRLWMYYKPVGLVTSESDEKGRQTVFDALPRDLPRVMSIGRLDLNSEGLLLLTNDGELKRRLELPATGWLRRYRVRVNGQPNELTFDPLRRGATIEGEDFQPMEIRIDGQKGANAWLTVGIREGKNREIRRAMSHVGLQVNRLIRIGYGPFKLTGMEENEVREVKRRVLRDQLGGLLTGETDEPPRAHRHGSAAEDGRRPGRQDRPDGPRRPRAAGDAPRSGFGKPRLDTSDGARKPFARSDARSDGGDDRRGSDQRPARPLRDRDDSDRKPRFASDRREGDGPAGAARKPRWSSKGAKPATGGAGESRSGAGSYARRDEGTSGPRGSEGRPYAKRDGDRPDTKRDGERKPYARREEGAPNPRRPDNKPFAKRDADSKPYARRDGDKPAPRRSSGPAPHGDGPNRHEPGDKPRSQGFKSWGDGARPRGEGGRGEAGARPRSEGFKPAGPRKGGFAGGGASGPGRAGAGKGPGGAGGRGPAGPRPGGKPRAPRG